MRDRSVLDPVEHLIDAWLRWEHTPSSRPACVERLGAIASLGLPSTPVHQRVAELRRCGFDVPSAIQRCVTDLGGQRCAT